jgi:hypothetical protein
VLTLIKYKHHFTLGPIMDYFVYIPLDRLERHEHFCAKTGFR